MTRGSTIYAPLAIPPSPEQAPQPFEPPELLALPEDELERTPVPVAALIGMFAASVLMFGEDERLYRIPYYMGIACGLVAAIMYLRMSLPIPTAVFLYAGWCLWSSVSCLLSEFREVSFASLGTAYQLLALVFVLATICQDSRAMWIISGWMMMGSLANVAASAAAGWEGLGGRSEGLLFNPNSTALAYGIAIVIQWIALAATRSMVLRIFIVGLLLATNYALVRTGSRSGFLCGLAAQTYVFWHYRQTILRRPALLVAVAVCGLAAAAWLPGWLAGTVLGERFKRTQETLTGSLGKREGSSYERITIKWVAIRETTKHPIFGLGMGNFWPTGIKTGAWRDTTHDNYCTILVETGVPGFLLFFSIYLWTWRHSSRMRRSEWITGSERHLVAMIRTFIILLITTDVFNDTTWRHKTVWTFMALSVGLLTGLERRVQHRTALARAAAGAPA